MAAFKGKDGTGWKDATIYGKDSNGWQYAKEAFAKNASGWQRVWTDCRLHDAGGRGWSDPVDVVTYAGSCGDGTQTTTTTRTKTGCPSDVRAVTVAYSFCYDGANHLGDNDCYNLSTVSTVYFDGSCSTRRVRTQTTTNPKAGSNCGSTTYYGTPYVSADCNSGCFTPETSYYFTGTCQSRTQTERTTYVPNAGSGCTQYFTDATPTASPTCGGNPPGACWTDVTCNYAGGSVTWDGVLFDVTDIGGGACYSQSRSNIFGCTGGQFELTRLYLCGSTQVYEGQCYSL
jgi:hypothetical protein